MSALGSVQLVPVATRNTVAGMQLDREDDGVAIQEVLLKLTGGRSVPRVFINGKFLGGGDETAAAAANGQLETLLKEAGVI